MKRTYTTAFPRGGVRGTNTFQRRVKRRTKIKPVVTTYSSRVPARTGGYRSNNVERKVFDIDPATSACTTGGTFNNMCIPQLGSDMTNRIGRKITIKSLYIRGFLELQTASTPTSPEGAEAQQARLIVFWDTQPNGSNPAVTDILKSATSYGQLNLNNRDRFKIIKDKTFVFDPFFYNTTATQSVAAWGKTIHQFKIYKNCNLEVIFNANSTGAVGDIASGNLCMLWIGSTSVGTDLNVQSFFTSRVRFVDY